MKHGETEGTENAERDPLDTGRSGGTEKKTEKEMEKEMGKEMGKEMEVEKPQMTLNELSGAVIGAAIEVHRTLGPGFAEAVYARAFAHELRLRGIPFEVQKKVVVTYKDVAVGEGWIDMLVDGRLVVEFKAMEGLHPVHRAQVVGYLKAAGLPLGLALNFGAATMRAGIMRVLLSENPDHDIKGHSA